MNEYEVKFFRVKIRRNKYYQNIHPCLNSSPAVGAAISNEYKWEIGNCGSYRSNKPRITPSPSHLPALLKIKLTQPTVYSLQDAFLCISCTSHTSHPWALQSTITQISSFIHSQFVSISYLILFRTFTQNHYFETVETFSTTLLSIS